MVEPSAPAASAAAGPATVPLLWRTIGYIEKHQVLIYPLIYALLYIYVTLIGLLYFLALYWVTGVNLFNFFELTDFLLAGLRHPMVLLVLIIVPLFFWIEQNVVMRWFIWWLEYMDKKPSSMSSTSSTTIPQIRSESRKSRLYFALATIVPAALLILSFIPLFTIEDKCGAPVRIYLRKDAVGEQQTDKPLLRIISSTQKMLLLEYVNEPADEPAYGLIPVDLVQKIDVQRRPPEDWGHRLACIVLD
jgi:hypothetical protein